MNSLIISTSHNFYFHYSVVGDTCVSLDEWAAHWIWWSKHREWFPEKNQGSHIPASEYGDQIFVSNRNFTALAKPLYYNQSTDLSNCTWTCGEVTFGQCNPGKSIHRLHGWIPMECIRWLSSRFILKWNEIVVLPLCNNVVVCRGIDWFASLLLLLASIMAILPRDLIFYTVICLWFICSELTWICMLVFMWIQFHMLVWCELLIKVR
jgi:hypothetical protein